MNIANAIIIILSILFYSFFRIRYYKVFNILSQSEKDEIKNILKLLNESQQNKYYRYTVRIYKLQFYYQIFIVILFIITTNDTVAEAGIWPFLALIPFHVICYYQYKNIKDEWKKELSSYSYRDINIEKVVSLNTSKYMTYNIGVYGKIISKIPFLFKTEDKSER